MSETKKVLTAENPDAENANVTGNESNAANAAVATPEEKEVVVNPDRKDIKVDKKRVNRTKVTLKGLTVALSDEEDAPNTFNFQIKEGIWGTASDAVGTRMFVDGVRSFPASSWGVIPTLRADMLFGNIIDYMERLTFEGKEMFERKFAHLLDRVILDVVQVYVPAGTPFVNPWSTLANPNAKVYEIDYVFTFITGFTYNIKDINHLKFMKMVYKGMPTVERDDDGNEVTVYNTDRLNDMLPPDMFAYSIIENNYFAKVTEKDEAMLVNMLGYK